MVDMENPQMTIQQRKEMELNHFARFFGSLLMDLKQVDEQERQALGDKSRPYANPRDSQVDFISYSR
jgi:hypothetical protein